MDRWIYWWIERRTDNRWMLDGKTDGPTVGLMDGLTDGLNNRLTIGHTNRLNGNHQTEHRCTKIRLWRPSSWVLGKSLLFSPVRNNLWTRIRLAGLGFELSNIWNKAHHLLISMRCGSLTTTYVLTVMGHIWIIKMVRIIKTKQSQRSASFDNLTRSGGGGSHVVEQWWR